MGTRVSSPTAKLVVELGKVHCAAPRQARGWAERTRALLLDSLDCVVEARWGILTGEIQEYQPQNTTKAMENGTAGQGEGRDPSGFLSQLHGNPVTVKLNSGVVYKGELQSVDGYMNIALEKTEEYVNGVKRRTYGDAFVRGNNGERTPASLDKHEN
ncbi:hypothetical protein TruAng_007382 [Truncatella angustata]|nr:hypothetical protein TruAng_007382 [Truncatella angustata]